MTNILCLVILEEDCLKKSLVDIGWFFPTFEVLVVEFSRYMMIPWVTMILDLHGSGHRIKRPEKNKASQVEVCDGLILDLHTYSKTK